MNASIRRGLQISLGMAILLATVASSPPRAIARDSAASAPAPAKTVSFLHDVHPILRESCAQCHIGGASKGEFRMDTREAVLAGGASGAAVVPGKSGESFLIRLVEGKEEGMVMPMKGPRLTDEQIGILRRWIDEGLVWEAGAPAPTNQAPPAPLPPRRPELPRPAFAAASANPVDLLLQAYFEKNGITPAAPVADAIFARRAHLDITGLLPTPAELDAFGADRRWDKREALIDRLLDDRRAYAEHWMTFWNDLLRNDFNGTGYIDGGRRQITPWLYESLAANKAFDQFVRELIRPTPESEGFVKGIVWRGVTNASQTPPMQAAQNISQVFMGTNLKCASCHDSFVNHWKLSETYGLAAVFADGPLELVRCDVPLGEKSKVRFLYPELGDIDGEAPREERMARLATLLTKEENGRLARTIVNRIWERFFGRGIVEPLDDLDQPPWNADLLDWLASELPAQGFDLKRIMRVMLTSRAYQLPAITMPEVQPKEYVFAGPAVRRITGEQFADAIGGLTGVWGKAPAARINLEKGTPRGERLLDEARRDTAITRWIWREAGAATDAPNGSVYFRHAFRLPDLSQSPLSDARIHISCDNAFTLYVNGVKAGEGKDLNQTPSFDIRRLLVGGWNSIAIEGVNGGGPGGLAAYARLRLAPGGGADAAASADGTDEIRAVLDFGTNADWFCTTIKFEGWEKKGFIPLEWPQAAELAGGVDAAPWHAAARLAEDVALVAAGRGRNATRAWLTNADALDRALGRPNREQVVTRRASIATTLQAVELTNGAALNTLLGEGAKRLLADAATAGADGKPESGLALARRLIRHATARDPAPEELLAAASLIGNPATAEGLQDFLWALAMQPEFQLIY